MVYLALSEQTSLPSAAVAEPVSAPVSPSAVVEPLPIGVSLGAHPLVVAIGAERGWTEDEIGALQHYGYLPRALGRRILRTATAAVAVSVLAVQRYVDFAEESI